MDALPLDTALAATLAEVADLEERDRAGQAHAAVRERMGYLHDLLRRLAGELAGLRREADALSGGEALWRQTQAELRAQWPEALRAPAAALTAGDLDLLRLVEYTSASIATVQERRSALRRAPPG